MSNQTAMDAPVPMTPEQKFFFDLRGWILLPSVLSASEIEEMKAEVYAGARHSYQGALQNLLDHPTLVGILNEILADERFIFDDCYGFRCENSVTTVRKPGWHTSSDRGTAVPACRTPATTKRMRCGIRLPVERYSQDSHV